MSDRQLADFNLVVHKECMRNFACSLGQVVNDGCQEFHYSGQKGIGEALLCAACKCHRSFHKKVTVKVQGAKPIPNFHPKETVKVRDDQPIPNFHHQDTVKVQGDKAIPNTVPIAAVPCSFYFPDHEDNSKDESDDNNAEKEETTPPAERRRDEGDENNAEEEAVPPPARRRRTRTVFTAEQKERMVRFSESYDWKPYRMVGRDVVLQFCLEIGITARNFQVWLGNSRRPPKDKNQPTDTASSVTGTGTTTCL